MNLLHLTLSFEAGGRREAIRTLARGLDAQGVQSNLVCIERLGCEPQLVKQFGTAVALERQHVGRRQAIGRLIQYCDQKHIDLIHTHDAAGQWLAAQMRVRRPKVKLIMTFHRSLGFESAGCKAKVRSALAGLATSAIIVGSRERRQHYLRENYVSSGKVVHIPFGIDLTRFRPNLAARQLVRDQLGLSNDTVVVGAVGHFGKEKGIDIAIQSFIAMHQRTRDGVLVVVGRGTAEQEKSLRALAAPAAKAIRFVGFCKDVERYFAAMDILLHVPRQEAFGLVVAEAMACGVPVVGAMIGGIPDMVRNGQTGFLAPAEQPLQIATELSRLVIDGETRKRMSTESRRVANTEYSDDLYAQRHLSLYRQILPQNSRTLRKQHSTQQGEVPTAVAPAEVTAERV